MSVQAHGVCEMGLSCIYIHMCLCVLTLCMSVFVNVAIWRM